MRIVRLAFVVLMLLAVWTCSLYASGFENTGLGTTARGMGGAFRAIADDWSAAYYNPAGYAFIIDNQLGTSLGLIHHRNEITPNYVDRDPFGNEYGWGIANGQAIYNFHRILNNPSAGFVARLPIWGETSFGFSIYQPFDQSLRWRFYDLAASGLRAYNEDAVTNIDIPGHHHLIDLDVVAFQVTMAKDYMDEKLALGIGLQLLRGDLWFTDLNFRLNPLEGEIANRPRDRIPQFADNRGAGWGFGVRGGLLWKFNDKINLGITAYVPFDLTITGETEHTFVLPKADYLVTVPGSPEFFFSSGEILHIRSDFEAELKLPASMALGLAMQVTDKLMVAFDAEYTLWSHYDGLAFAYDSFDGVPNMEEEFFTRDLAKPVEWDNAGKVSLGLRYDANDVLTLLAGGCADQSPMRNAFEFTPQFMDLATKKSYNGGAVLHINQWDLGLITSYYDYPDISVGSLTDLDEDNLYDNFPGWYKAETFETVLSVVYRF